MQTEALHELVLRDTIRDHARFLNFFGDRFNPKDLYERSKHPDWVVPPDDFTAAIPRLTHVTTNAAGDVLDTAEFRGTLQLSSEHILAGYRVTLELDPVFEALEQAQHDVLVDVTNTYWNPAAKGALAIEVHRNGKRLDAIDVATSETKIQVRVPAVSRHDRVTVSVVALKDNARKSWSRAAQTSVRTTIKHRGVDPAFSFSGRAKTWVRRRTKRRRGVKRSTGAT